MSSGCVCADIWAGELNLSPECIGRLWIFDRLTTDELKVIGASAMRKLYHPGEAIFHQGDPATTMFLIKGGRVRLDKFTEDGSEIFLDIRKSGDFIGEYMLNVNSLYAMLVPTSTSFHRQISSNQMLEHPIHNTITLFVKYSS